MAILFPRIVGTANMDHNLNALIDTVNSDRDGDQPRLAASTFIAIQKFLIEHRESAAALDWIPKALSLVASTNGSKSWSNDIYDKILEAHKIRVELDRKGIRYDERQDA
jgi:hypothetical protein